MVQTRSQAKTTKSTTRPLSSTTSKRNTTAKVSKTLPESQEDDPLKASTLKGKAKKPSASAKSTKTPTEKDKDDEKAKDSRKIASGPAETTSSKLFKSSLQEAPRRGRKKTAENKKDEGKTEIKRAAKQEDLDIAETVRCRDTIPSQGTSSGCRDETKIVKNVGREPRSAGANTKQQKEEEEEEEEEENANTTLRAKGRGRRAAKADTSVDESAVAAGRARKTAQPLVATKAACEKRANIRQKRAVVQVQMPAGEHSHIQKQVRGKQEQTASEKAFAGDAHTASKRRKISKTKAVPTKSASKAASRSLNAMNGKATVAPTSNPLASPIGQNEPQISHQPTPSLLQAAPRRSPLKQSAGSTALIKPLKSPVRMLMTITPAKRCNDDLAESEDGSDVEEKSKECQLNLEWERMRNVDLRSISGSPVKLVATRPDPSRISSKEATEGVSVPDRSVVRDGEETEEEDEIAEDDEASRETKTASPIISEKVAIMSSPKEVTAVSPTATEVDRPPIPFTFKPSSHRFLAPLTPMYPTNGVADSKLIQNKEKVSTAENCNNAAEKHNSCEYSQDTTLQLSEKGKHTTLPSRLFGGGASQSPFGASAQPLTPFRPAPSMKRAATCAAGAATGPSGCDNVAPNSARMARDATAASQASNSTSMFRSIMRMPQRSGNEHATLSTSKSAKVPKNGQGSPKSSPSSSPRPVHAAAGGALVAPSTPCAGAFLGTRSGRRMKDPNEANQSTDKIAGDSSVDLHGSRRYGEVPMTEPPVPRSILKSAMKMPASSVLSASAAVVRVKKLAFVDEENIPHASDNNNGVQQKAADSDHCWSLQKRSENPAYIRRSASPAKSVTFHSADPLPDTPTTQTRRKQPMAATAEDIYEYVDEMDTAEEVFAQDGMEDGRRTSLAGSVSGQILAGAVFYVDVNSADGADAADIFIPLLTEMGATCVPRWQNSLDGVTHVLFKDGQIKTLEKVLASKGTIKCVNIGWPLE